MLDNQMAQFYNARRRALRGGQRNKLSRAQNRWIGQRQACRGSVSCVNRIYLQRITQLQ